MKCYSIYSNINNQSYENNIIKQVNRALRDLFFIITFLLIAILSDVYALVIGNYKNIEKAKIILELNIALNNHRPVIILKPVPG